jgi:hypothetical protein
LNQKDLSLKKKHQASPVITTIIPTYKRPKSLERAIKSAQEQQINGLLVSVFDNHSSDETKQVVQSLKRSDSILTYHQHEKNIGAAANFEFGLNAVKTPFFSILSDDDYLLPCFYKKALDALDKNPDAMFWAGITLNVDEDNNIWDAKVSRWPREGVFLPPDGIMHIMNGMSPTWTGIVFRQEVLEKIGLPDRETLGPSDLDFVLKIAAKFPYIVHKHPSAVFTLNTASFSSTQPLSSFWPGWKKMFVNIEEFIADYGDDEKKTAMATMHADARRMLFRRGANAIAQKRNDFAKDAAEALRNDYHQVALANTLLLISSICENIPVAQKVYSSAYKWAERRIIDRKKEIKTKYEHLIRQI